MFCFELSSVVWLSDVICRSWTLAAENTRVQWMQCSCVWMTYDDSVKTKTPGSNNCRNSTTNWRWLTASLMFALLISLWPRLRCDVDATGVRGRAAELSLCVVHCNVYCCIITLHNSTNSSNRSIDMIVSVSVWLALSSKCLCNILYFWHYIFFMFVITFYSSPCADH